MQEEEDDAVDAAGGGHTATHLGVKWPTGQLAAGCACSQSKISHPINPQRAALIGLRLWRRRRSDTCRCLIIGIHIARELWLLRFRLQTRFRTTPLRRGIGRSTGGTPILQLRQRPTFGNVTAKNALPAKHAIFGHIGGEDFTWLKIDSSANVIAIDRFLITLLLVNYWK